MSSFYPLGRVAHMFLESMKTVEHWVATGAVRTVDMYGSKMVPQDEYERLKKIADSKKP